MKRTPEDFKIIFYEKFDHLGKLDRQYYYIKERKKFLWFSKWKPITHQEISSSTIYTYRIIFKTIEEAQKFIDEVLMFDILRDGCRETVVSGK